MGRSRVGSIGHGVVAWLLLAAVLLLPVPSTPAAVAATSSPKPLLTGLMSRQDEAPEALRGVVRSYALKVLWRDLQPLDGETLDTAALDAALDRAASSGVRVRLRVFAGVHSPDWAKALGGGGVAFVDPFDGKQGTIPRFWTPAFGEAYARLQTLLARRYDADARVAEVVVSRCSAFYPETFLRQTSVASNRAALVGAGYTVEADKACHREQIEAHTVWTRTRSGLALNPAQFVTSTQAAQVDDAFTAEMMTYCRSVLGQRCVLANMSIRSPIESLDGGGTPHYRLMYDAMRSHGPPYAFQTAVESRIGDCAATLAWAVDFDAASVELPLRPEEGGCTLDVLTPVASVLGRPTVPQSFAASTAGGGTQVRLSWQAPARSAGSPVTSYRVWRWTGAQAPARVATLAGTARAWTDLSPPRRRTVSYRIDAVSVAGPGPATATRSVATR